MSRILPRSHNHATLIEEREHLNDILEAGDMAHCRLCKQPAKVYRRTIFSTMARHLITVHQAHGRDWFRLSTAINDSSGNFAKLALWNLVEEESVRRPDGGRSGWWRVTPLGSRFVRRRETVPKWVLTYNAKIVGVDSSKMIGIEDALGRKFRYDELMRGV